MIDLIFVSSAGANGPTQENRYDERPDSSSNEITALKRWKVCKSETPKNRPGASIMLTHDPDIIRGWSFLPETFPKFLIFIRDVHA